MFAYKTLKSGTDIRGVASEGGGAPINLTDEVVERIAAGFLVWCEKHLDKCAEGLKIAVGHDSRISADRIAVRLLGADYGEPPPVLPQRTEVLHACGRPGQPGYFRDFGICTERRCAEGDRQRHAGAGGLYVEICR